VGKAAIEFLSSGRDHSFIKNKHVESSQIDLVSSSALMRSSFVSNS
jgi:hypothetical protein